MSSCIPQIRAACLAVLLLVTAAPALAMAAPSAEQAYESARASYRTLKRDPARRKLRHNWLNVAHRFQAFAEKHPRSPRAAEALFTAGQLFQDLSQISLVQEDRVSAASTFREMVAQHPRDPLADDAALALAKLELERLNHPEDARRTLQDALKHLPRGDRAKELLALLASIPARTPAAREPARDLGHATSRDDAPRELASRHLETEPAAASRPDRDAAPREVGTRRPDVEAAPERRRDRAEPEVSPPLARHADVPPAPAAHLALPKLRAAPGEPTLAEQLGLKMRRVVIDPGHGGHDSGAVGKDGTLEKEVSLAISEKLADKLQEAGLEVVLTRDDDTFVPLEERSRRANAAKGDLFVSIHCNSAASSKLHGVETYTLNISSDRYAIRLAARENAASEKGMSDLQFILADLATKVNTDESRRLADQVQARMVTELGEDRDVKNLGTKEALFYVLLGAKMPAILVETSFLSNPEEEALLGSPRYQDSVAEAIAGGIRSFLGERERVARMN